jgi:hypothetical protein
MAENKTSFLLYCDIHHTIKKLTDNQSGKLFKHILSYVNDENPELNDLLLEVVFEPIKQSLKRDLKRYEAICLRNKDNGSKGGRPKSKIKKPKKPSGLITNPNNPDGSRNNPNNPDEPDSDSDIDSDIDSDSEKKKRKNKYCEFVSMFSEEHDKLISEHGEKNTKLFIEILNNYKGSNGKKYKSDYLAILNWVIDKAKKEGKYEQKPKFVF